MTQHKTVTSHSHIPSGHPPAEWHNTKQSPVTFLAVTHLQDDGKTTHCQQCRQRGQRPVNGDLGGSWKAAHQRAVGRVDQHALKHGRHVGQHHQGGVPGEETCIADREVSHTGVLAPLLSQTGLSLAPDKIPLFSSSSLQVIKIWPLTSQVSWWNSPYFFYLCELSIISHSEILVTVSFTNVSWASSLMMKFVSFTNVSWASSLMMEFISFTYVSWASSLMIKFYCFCFYL